MLQYDTNAFNFFALSLISIYIIPSWRSIFKSFSKAFFASDADIGAVVRTTAEKKKASEVKKTMKGFQTISSSGFIFNLCITTVLTIIFLYLILSVQEDGEVNSFDPFTILDVDMNADTKTIKKAYKTMSLKYHPDKNPNNPSAEAMFMMVAKAYESLTDPESMENYKKYGNPDGKQSLEVSIGLPSFLLEAGNRNLVLLFYLIFMVVLVPFSVWKYYSDSSKYGEKDVMYDTYSWYHHTLNEHSIVKVLPEAFAGSAEFRKANVTTTATEKKDITSIMSKVKSQMQKPKYMHPIVVKGNVLMHAHLLRKTEQLSAKSKDDLNNMLRKSGALVEAMITVCKHQDWMKTAVNCIEFGQCITQAVWTKDSNLLQLPHFTAEEAKHCEKAKASQRASNVLQFIKIPDEDKKGMAYMADEQKADVLACCDIFPQIAVDYQVYVDDDEDDKVYEGDLLTIEVCITRTNLKEGEKAGLVHAPRFPFPKAEAWWILCGTTEGKIIAIDKVTDADRVVKHKIKLLAPKQGEYEFDLFVKSNAYLGLDHKQKIKVTTHDPSTLPQYKIHPEDAQLDDEPTLFEEMMAANIEDDSDSDDSDDEEEEEGIKELSAAERKKQELRKARKKAAGDDSDSDSDSDVEEVYTDK